MIEVQYVEFEDLYKYSPCTIVVSDILNFKRTLERSEISYQLHKFIKLEQIQVVMIQNMSKLLGYLAMVELGKIQAPSGRVVFWNLFNDLALVGSKFYNRAVGELSQDEHFENDSGVFSYSVMSETQFNSRLINNVVYRIEKVFEDHTHVFCEEPNKVSWKIPVPINYNYLKLTELWGPDAVTDSEFYKRNLKNCENIKYTYLEKLIDAWKVEGVVNE